jgi:hypothetical protein
MIKLFALEKKVQKDMADKRDTELKYIVWGKMLQLLNNLLKSVLPYDALNECLLMIY